MREPVASKSNLNQVCVLVEGLEENSLNVLWEEVVNELDVTDFIVGGKSIDEIEKTSVVESATGEVESSETDFWLLLLDDVREISKHFISKEVLVANEDLKLAGWKNVTDGLESSRANLIEWDVELLHLLILLECLSDQSTTVISNDVSFDVEHLERVVRLETFGDPFGSCD